MGYTRYHARCRLATRVPRRGLNHNYTTHHLQISRHTEIRNIVLKHNTGDIALMVFPNCRSTNLHLSFLLKLLQKLFFQLRLHVHRKGDTTRPIRLILPLQLRREGNDVVLGDHYRYFLSPIG